MTDCSESSNPSIVTEFSSSELLENAENLKSPEKMSTNDRSKLKKRMLMKKLALVDDSIPKLALPDNYMDVAAREDETRELNWLAKRFPPSHSSKSVNTDSTSRVVQRKEQKHEILLKLSHQRRKAQEKRKEMYALDNEELNEYKEGEEDEEEKEEEEEEEEEDGEEEEEEEEELKGEDLEEQMNENIEHFDENEDNVIDAVKGTCESLDEDDYTNICENKESAVLEGKDEQGDAVKVDSQTAISGDTSLPLPDSLSQWFNRSDDRLLDNPMNKKGMFEEFIQLNSLGGKEGESKYDLLNLCSGNFASQDSGEYSTEEVDEDEIALVRKRKEVSSDVEQDQMKIKEELNGGNELDDDWNKCEDNDRREEQHNKVFNRVLFDSDEESDGNDEFNDESEENEQVDSDDEMAVFRRQEKERRRDWVEEEAELSGDDVGSDGEEDEDLLNHYEAEEGDLDTVPDEDELRMDLHKQLMKQQESSDHRELLQLRERLLGDDMTGSETNRTFRLKLREGLDGMESAEYDETNEEEEETNDEDNIEVIKRRMEIEKMKEASGEVAEKGTSAVDVFSSITRSTTLANRLGGRVRASLLHMDSSKMLGKENVSAKEKKTFFVSKESNDDNEKECTESLPAKRKNTIIDETNVKKFKHSSLSRSSVFSKFD